MKKTLSTVLIANLVFLYPSLECSQAFAGMNAEGKSFDLNAVPDANFSLQTPFNLDLPNEIPGIAASLDNANDIIKEIKLGTPNLSPELNFIGREFSPIVRTSQKTAASNQSPINAATPLRHPSANSSFLKAEHFVSDEIKAWETPKALTAAGLNLNFDNNANKDSSLVSQENNSEGGVFQTEIDPKTFPAPFNNSEMLAFVQRKVIKAVATKRPYQYNSPVSNVESYPSANITPKNRQGVNWTVYDINGELWFKSAPVALNSQAFWYDLGPKPEAFPRVAALLQKTSEKSVINNSEDTSQQTNANQIKAGDVVVYDVSGRRYTVTVQEIYSDGTALVSYSSLFDDYVQYLPVSKLIKQVSRIADLKVGDHCIYKDSNGRYQAGTIANLYSDKTAKVILSVLSDQFQYLPISILTKIP